jgi:hypothetical protein
LISGGLEELDRGVVISIGHSDSVGPCGWMGVGMVAAIEPAVQQGLGRNEEMSGGANGRGLSFAGGVEQAALGDVDEQPRLTLPPSGGRRR